MYALVRRLMFLFPPERVHYLAMNLLGALCSIGFLRNWMRRLFAPTTAAPVSLFGLRFRNAIGLGAGFDKNAAYLDVLETLGFGFVEIGTVTPKPQEGNNQPRLFRLPKDGALINRMGFNNDGADVIAARLKAWRANRNGAHNGFLVGGNIGKNKSTPNDEAWKDYEACFLKLHPYVDFFVVNVSSPNTPGLRALQEKDALHKILVHLQGLDPNPGQKKPLLLKIAPDLTDSQLQELIELATAIKLDGLVATNTTISREGLLTDGATVAAIGAGGLSGKPVKERSNAVLRFITERTRIPVIGSGGIFTAADAREKIAYGASLVEVWTGFIYEGPFIVRNICR